jgi:hypothetical protein
MDEVLANCAEYGHPSALNAGQERNLAIAAARGLPSGHRRPGSCDATACPGRTAERA